MADRTMRAMRVIDRWRALNVRERRQVVEAAALVLTSMIGVRLGAAPRLLRASRSQSETSVEPDELRELATAVARASRYTPGTTCLSRALALQWMLARRGIAADVRLGVRTDEGRLSAHAWVECQGVVLDDRGIVEQYAALR